MVILALLHSHSQSRSQHEQVSAMAKTSEKDKAAPVSEERKQILLQRRELRKAKKAKGRSFKQEKQRQRREKKAEIIAKIRAKRDEAAQAQQGGGAQDGCW
ncbi:hypothetical protein BBJ28_00022916, partial [Nothophytophthora sp. Chile5]